MATRRWARVSVLMPAAAQMDRRADTGPSLRARVRACWAQRDRRNPTHVDQDLDSARRTGADGPARMDQCAGVGGWRGAYGPAHLAELGFRRVTPCVTRARGPAQPVHMASRSDPDAPPRHTWTGARWASAPMDRRTDGCRCRSPRPPTVAVRRRSLSCERFKICGGAERAQPATDRPSASPSYPAL